MTAVADPTSIGGVLAIVFNKDFIASPSQNNPEIGRSDHRARTSKVEPENRQGSLPTIQVSHREYIDAQIIMNPMPRVSSNELNHCTIERIINHVKDAYIRGEYDDGELEKWLNGRSFSFCMTYVFLCTPGDNLSINFYVSRTEGAPAWRTPISAESTSNPVNASSTDSSTHYVSKQITKSKKTKGNKPAECLVTPMSQDEVNLVRDAFVRQCVRALQNYVSLVYDYSIKHDLVPNYYSTGLPGTI